MATEMDSPAREALRTIADILDLPTGGDTPKQVVEAVAARMQPPTHDRIPATPGFYWYRRATGPSVVVEIRAGEGFMRGTDGSRQGWMHRGEQLLGPLVVPPAVAPQPASVPVTQMGGPVTIDVEAFMAAARATSRDGGLDLQAVLTYLLERHPGLTWGALKDVQRRAARRKLVVHDRMLGWRLRRT